MSSVFKLGCIKAEFEEHRSRFSSATMSQTPTIDLLLNLAAERPATVLEQLQLHPGLASKQDAHGYSLLHAAVSYGHADLMKALIETYNVDPNIKDEDDETCLFNAESVEFAKESLALGVDIGARNADGQTAADKLDDEDEQPEVAAYLREVASGGADVQRTQSSTTSSNQANGTHAPPPLPNGVQVNLGTMAPDEVGEEPDPEFRRRIEELAAREDFEGEEGQRELRDLISDAVSGMSSDGQGPASRRRVG